MVWPWTLTFWPKNVIRSSMSQDAPVTKVWRKSWILEISRKHKTTTWITDRRTDVRTHGQRHGWTTWKHIASATGAYSLRRRLPAAEAYKELRYVLKLHFLLLTNKWSINGKVFKLQHSDYRGHQKSRQQQIITEQLFSCIITQISIWHMKSHSNSQQNINEGREYGMKASTVCL